MLRVSDECTDLRTGTVNYRNSFAVKIKDKVLQKLEGKMQLIYEDNCREKDFFRNNVYNY